ncbi:MAG: hypothetical protein LBT59_02160 [Clostridiales bacterium]|jgi:hypothetical protein|nr:hypothetical protein [Clostridiales bacterium]
MKPWKIKIFKCKDENSVEYVANHEIRKTFAFKSLPKFKEACRFWSNNDIEKFCINPDAIEFGRVFESATLRQPIIIETDDFQFIPFEALRVAGMSLGERNRVSRMAKGDRFETGYMEEHHSVLILKVFPLESHRASELQVIGAISQFKKIKIESLTATDLDELITLVTNSDRDVIHILGDVKDDSFAGGEYPINMSDLKWGLEGKNIAAKLVFLDMSGKLAFEKPGDENMFSPFISAKKVKAVVGMSRTIYPTMNKNYLREFYLALFRGNTIGESVRLAVATNTAVSMPKEEDPLPMVLFGNPVVTYTKPKISFKPIAIALAIFLALAAIALPVAYFATRPKFENLKITDLVIAGNVKGLPNPPAQSRNAVVVLALLSNGSIAWPEERYTELSQDGSFECELFESLEERLLADACYLFVINVDPQVESFLKHSTISEFKSWVNDNKIYGVERRLRTDG